MTNRIIVPRATWLVAGLLLLLAQSGCTPRSYLLSADTQVQQILDHREQQVLGYQPQVRAPTTVPAMPAPRAYARIPVTPTAPPTTAPIQQTYVAIPAEPLGPPLPNELAPSDDLMSNLFSDRLLVPYTSERYLLGPPNPAETAIHLDLFRSIGYAIQHSPGYQSHMEDLYLTTLDVTLQRHLFAPRPFVTTGLHYTGGQRDINYQSALNATASAGVRQQLPYGGEVVAQTLVGFVDALSGNVDDGESAQVALSATVPLLRGAGMVNLESLIDSERTLVYTVRSFEDYRRQFAVDIASQYFSLLTQQRSLANRQRSYQSLSNVTEQTQALYAAGRLRFVEVQRAQQALLNAENSLVTAQDSYQSALDSYKILIGMPIDQELEVVPVELTLNIPQASDQEVRRLTLQYRLDLQTARDRIDDARRAVTNARNGLLPDLDVDANVSLANSAGRPASHLDSGTLQYGAGVTLDLPVDRVAERNTYRRALTSLQRSQRNYQQLRDQVIVSARDALRGIRTSQVSLEIQRLGIELARRRLEYNSELLKTGDVTSRDVVDAESSLVQAQDAYDQALARLQISVLRYLRETGTLRVDPQAGLLGQAMAGQVVLNKTAAEQ